ncbi:MAG: hypothetical protein IPM39_27885 [Chloroflexi bacterium]|nr:hypothetical protein [Chloroflexota bacterium]
MRKQTNPSLILSILGITIALIQIFDIVIHATTNQLEPLRVIANVVILLWLAGVASGRLKARFQPTAVVASCAYLVLNLIFLAREGIRNPEQGGELRILLFILMFLTVTLSFILTYSYEHLRYKKR